MASSAMKLSLFLLLTLLSSLTQARDSQFFNKNPSTTNNKEEPNVLPDNQNNNQQQQQEPNFLPDNENSYGLYGHESAGNPPSTTTTPEFKQPDHKYLPKNYNPVAYVTQPDDFTQETSFATNPDNNNQQKEGEGEAEAEEEFRSYPTTTANDNRDNYYYNGGSSFRSQPQRQFNGGFEPQGMSDTRVVANGKYFYDLNSEKFSSNHPYESLRAQGLYDTRNFYVNNADEVSNRDFNEFNTRNFYGNNENEFNAEGYQNFQNEENLP